MKINKLSEVSMGFSLGIVSAGSMLILSLGTKIGFYTNVNVIMQKTHMFYNLSFFGTLSGMIEAGIIGFIIGYLIIKIYNILENITKND